MGVHSLQTDITKHAESQKAIEIMPRFSQILALCVCVCVCVCVWQWAWEDSTWEFSFLLNLEEVLESQPDVHSEDNKYLINFYYVPETAVYDEETLVNNSGEVLPFYTLLPSGSYSLVGSPLNHDIV